MHWNEKNCQGTPSTLTYKQAQALATEQSNATGQRWRLPRVNELRRLIDRSVQPQGLNPELFPTAPRDWHWTGTASVNAQPVNSYNYSQISGQGQVAKLSAQQAWAMDMESLQARPDMGRGNQLFVRLVRAMSPDDLPTPAK